MRESGILKSVSDWSHAEGGHRSEARRLERKRNGGKRDRPRSGRELQKEITMVMDKEFRGNAYIIKNKEVLLTYSGGFADLANEIPNTIDTRFASASMRKTFVAVGILQLIEEEKLKFEDTIGSILDFDLRQIDLCTCRDAMME